MKESNKLIRNETEAIECLKSNKPTSGYVMLQESIDMAIQALEKVQQYREIGTLEELQNMKSDYCEALSDWRQYRKIGTLEECRTAIEKQIPKKPNKTIDSSWGTKKEVHTCPVCDCDLTEVYFIAPQESEIKGKITYCEACGQAIDWSDAE